MISENPNSIDVNSGLFSLGSKGFSSSCSSKADRVAAESFREKRDSQKTALETAQYMGGLTLNPSENDLALRELAQEFIAFESFDAAEEESSKISDVSTKESVFVELAGALFKNGEFQRAEAVARRISTPQMWDRVLSIFLEFKPSILPEKPVKTESYPILRQLEGPPALAGERGSFGCIEILTDHRVQPRDLNSL